MSNVTVLWQDLLNEGDSLLKVGRKLGIYESRLQQVKDNMAGTEGFAKLNKALRKVDSDVEQYVKDIKQLGRSARKIAVQYRNTEQHLIRQIFEWSDVWGVVSSAGAVGGSAATLGNIFTEHGADGIGNFLQVIGGMAEGAYDGDPNAFKEALFNTGADPVVAAISEKGVKAGWAEAINGYKFAKGNTVGKNLNVAAQWASAIIGNTAENFEEFGTIDNPRFWGETAIETGVDVGMSIGATVGVGAAAVALGVTAAPAVVVAAAASVVVMGTNKVVDHFTGKDVGEWFSDGICDGFEWLADKVGNAKASNKNAVSIWATV